MYFKYKFKTGTELEFGFTGEFIGGILASILKASMFIN